MNAIASPAAVAERFRTAFLAEENGALEVRSGPTTYAILFDRGMVAGAEMRHRENGASTAAHRSTAEVLREAFACLPDDVVFAPGASPQESQADILNTVELFLDGIRTMAGFEEILDALLALQNRLALRPNPAVPLERLTLKPIHGFVLSRLGGSLSFSEIAATVGPDDEAEAARFIFALLLLGSVALDPPLGEGLFSTDMLVSDHKRDFAREEAEVSFIRDTYNSMLGQSPYKILGIEEAAPADEARKAYEERKRVLAAERFLPRVRDRMRSELTIIEARLTEVYLALQSGAAVRALESAPARESLDFDALSLRREFTKTEVAANIDEQERLAESYYQKAKKYYSQGDYFNCIQYCTQALRQNDQAPRYLMLLGDAQAHNPDRRWQKMAEQSYLQGIKLDPWNADYLVMLGLFYKKQGFAVRARRQFEKALQIQPSHQKAQEELAAADSSVPNA